MIGATTKSVCTFCPSGTYSGSGASTCTECPIGKASNVTAATEISTCVECEAGSYCPRGSSYPILCPSGTWGDKPGMGNCSLCPQGTFNAFKGSNLSSACVACAAGRFSSILGAPASSACSKCPVNTYQDKAGKSECKSCLGRTSTPNRLACSCPEGQILALPDSSTDSELVCFQCPNGTVAVQLGTSEEGSCAECALGSFCTEGKSYLCPSGKWSGTKMLTSQSNCTSCVAGTFNPSYGQISADSCIPCSSGYWSSAAAPQCTPCESGKYSSRVASTDVKNCLPCEIGTYSDSPGQAVCIDRCLKGYYGTTDGGRFERDSCLKCPSGSTVSLGATSVAQCTEPVDCPAGKQYQPKSPPKKLMFEDDGCTTLSCPSPLLNFCVTINSTKIVSSCLACGPGNYITSGAAVTTTCAITSSCKPCSESGVCPGFLHVELWNPSISLALDNSNVSARLGFKNSRCLAAAAAPSVLIPLTPGAFSETSLPSIAAVGIGVGLILSIFLTVVCVVRTARPRARIRDREPCSVRCAAFLSTRIKSADGFALFHRPIENEPQRYVPSLLGGFCNLAGYLTFAIIATFYCLRFGYDNSVATVSLNTVRADYNPFTPDVPWASPVSSVTPSLPASSVQVRILAHSELGCTKPVTMAGVGLAAGSWKNESSIDCEDRRSLLSFTCSSCDFTPASSFHFTLPYTCQATYVEIISADATGALQFVALKQDLTTATNSAFLKSVSWTVSVTSAFYDNLITSKQARGYQLRSEASSSTLSTSIDAKTPTLKPLESSVSFSIHLPLASAFSYTKLAPRQTYADLASTLVGLLGLLGAFRFFFEAAERLCAPAPAPDPAAVQRALKAAVPMKDLPAPRFQREPTTDVFSSSPPPRPSSLREYTPDRVGAIVLENPLRSSGRALTPQIDDADALTGSRRHLGPRDFSHDDFDATSTFAYASPSSRAPPLSPVDSFHAPQPQPLSSRHIGPPGFSHDEPSEPGGSSSHAPSARRHLAPAGFSLDDAE